MRHQRVPQHSREWNSSSNTERYDDRRLIHRNSYELGMTLMAREAKVAGWPRGPKRRTEAALTKVVTQVWMNIQMTRVNANRFADLSGPLILDALENTTAVHLHFCKKSDVHDVVKRLNSVQLWSNSD